MRSPAGFHLLKLNDRRGSGGDPFAVEQLHVRHILVRVGELVSEAERAARSRSLGRRIVQGENFADLARLNSDDTASAQRGGDLRIVPGDLVPEFEQAAAALKPSQLSEPVRTSFGLHLIQLLERRADLSVDRRRLEARKVLRERRGDASRTRVAAPARPGVRQYRLEER